MCLFIMYHTLVVAFVFVYDVSYASCYIASCVDTSIVLSLIPMIIMCFYFPITRGYTSGASGNSTRVPWSSLVWGLFAHSQIQDRYKAGVVGSGAGWGCKCGLEFHTLVHELYSLTMSLVLCMCTCCLKMTWTWIRCYWSSISIHSLFIENGSMNKNFFVFTLG